MYQRTSTYNRRASTQNLRRNQNTVVFSSAVKLGPVTHTVIIALMITVLGLIYLTQATKATSYDYKVQAIDSKIADMNSTKTDLELENARLTALSSVKGSSVAKAMAPADSTAYVAE